MLGMPWLEARTGFVKMTSMEMHRVCGAIPFRAVNVSFRPIPITKSVSSSAHSKRLMLRSFKIVNVKSEI